MSKHELQVARVVAEHKTQYIIRYDGTEILATVRGKFHLEEDFPKVGDFVEFVKSSSGQGFIEKVLPRKTKVVRDNSERSRRFVLERPQVIVANVDVVFIVMGLDNDFNKSRLERYILLAKQSDVKAVIVLNKVDMVKDPEIYEMDVKKVSGDIPVHLVSALSGFGMEFLLPFFSSGETGVLLGSSGSGKSTITNWLLGKEKQAVQNVREDDSRGRHTTTSRELFSLPRGGYLIDTPGMRGLGMVDDFLKVDQGVLRDIELLIKNCSFSDCDHEKSEGCAVLDSIQKGELEQKHFDNYQKLKKESEQSKKKVTRETIVNRKKRVQNIYKDRKNIDEE